MKKLLLGVTTALIAATIGCGTQSKSVNASNQTGFDVVSKDDIGGVRVFRLKDSETGERFVLVTDLSGRNSIIQVK
jgi:hypothetical protein